MVIAGPITLAHAVVFSYVADRIDPKAPTEPIVGQLAGRLTHESDVAGTPWERNPSHLSDKSD